MDMAAAIEILVPGADYQGSATGWDEAKYNALRWHDSRSKPTWGELSEITEAQTQRPNASLPRMDFMMALKQAGIYLQAADYAASLARDHDWRIRWETAQTFHRTNPDLVAGAKELGLTDADLDAIFSV